MDKQTIILHGGNIAYDRADAEVSIEELIMALETARDDGATHVVMSSGNYRGAQWATISDDWTWVDEDDI